jgi:hypothetical protein
VALQKLDEAKRQVVKAAAPPEFDPISLVGFDYAKSTLTLTLSRNVPPGWAQEFQHPRGGHGSILGYGPEMFDIRGDKATIRVREDPKLIQDLINYAKGYCEAANRGYVTMLRENAAREEREQRAALERKIAEAELRKQILSTVKL